MYCSSALLVAVLAAIAQAVRFDFDGAGFSPVEGVPITIKYSEAAGPVTITLKNGPNNDLKTVVVITSDLPAGSGSFTWVPEDLPSDTYALEISDGQDSNYSPQFSYLGTGPATPTISSTSSEDSTSSTATPTSTTSMDTTMTTMTTTESSSESSSTTGTTSSRTTSSTAEATTEPVNQNGDSGSSRIGTSMALALGAVAILALFN